jgi:hypothetical protein
MVDVVELLEGPHPSGKLRAKPRLLIDREFHSTQFNLIIANPRRSTTGLEHLFLVQNSRQVKVCVEMHNVSKKNVMGCVFAVDAILPGIIMIDVMHFNNIRDRN